MKTVFVSELEAGQELENVSFLLQDISQRTTKDGRPYILGSLRDKSGQIACVFWDIPEYVSSWATTGQFAMVTGRVVKYKDVLQISITDMNRYTQPDMADFLPTSQRPQSEMIAHLKELIASLSQPWQELLTSLLLNDDFLPRFANAPAARAMHHAYVGGLLEHTLSMATIAQQLAEHYPYVNKDLLLAGTLLHDMGKMTEYEVDDSFSFSEDGRLIGHIVRAIVQIETAAAQTDFSQNDLRNLIHLIASHHGTLEWGSPVRPKTLEAILLHQIDLLDSRVQGYFDFLVNDASETEWTTKSSPMFGTELRKPDGFEPPGSS